jgi:putative phosphoribosyl transferase
MSMFANRSDAGRRLAQALAPYADSDAIVLGLPRGGVPVAYEVARALDTELDVLIVRKIGMPGQPELALGAVASGGALVLNERLVHMAGQTADSLRRLELRELAEVNRRERTFRGNRRPLALKKRTVILVDDGAATGATMLVAIRCARRLHARRVIVALPVASSDAYDAIAREADEVICLDTPSPFDSVGEWYGDFTQTEDEQVRTLLDAAERIHAAH